MEISNKCRAITPSMTLEMDAKAKKMKAEGIDVIGFGAGEPDFDTPSFIKEAAKEALDKGLTKYTPASGTIELRKAICAKFERRNGLHYTPEQIVVSNGAKHSLFNAFAAILNDGDEVILPSPYWVTYPELIRYHGGVPVYVETTAENGFCPQLSDIEKALSSKTKAILVNSPCNPTGAVYGAALLEGIAKLAQQADCYVISDEIYEELIYDGETHVSIASFGPEIQERTILVNGLSKVYAMTGWRIGYTASNLAVAKAMGSLQSHATSNPNSIAMYASVAAMNGPRDEIDVMRSAFDRRRKYMLDRIAAIDGLSAPTPRGAFYVALNISKLIGKTYRGKAIRNSLDFADLLLEGANVAVVPGAAFGDDGFCRLSYAMSDKDIEIGLDRIAAFVAELA